MKFLKIYILFVIAHFVHISQGQINEEDLTFVVDYVGTYSRYENQSAPYKEYFRLMKRQDSSIFQSINNMTKDSLLVEMEKTQVYRKVPNTHHSYTIRYQKDSLVYWNNIYRKNYRYEEIIKFEWEFLSETKVISGYNCKLASVNYGGRTWFAWYAVDLPIDAGPYKFKGLPGLILRCYDKNVNYHWEFFKLYKSKKKFTFQKYYLSPNISDLILTNRDDFNQKQYTLKNATLAELNDSGASGFAVGSISDDSKLRKSNSTNGRGFIPIELNE